jgi:chromosome segregation ATPase
MAMEPDDTGRDPASLDPLPNLPGPVPIWVWLLVVLSGAIAIFSAHTALTKNQLYWESETARETLSHDKSRLEANVTDLKQQLDQANAARQDTVNALNQSRADTQTALGQIKDLQGKVTNLEAKLTTAETNAKQASDAKDALAADVERLKHELADTQKKLAAAQADLAQVQAQNQSPPPAPATQQPPVR